MTNQELRGTDQGQEPDPIKDTLGAVERKLSEGDKFVPRSTDAPAFVAAVEEASKKFQLRAQTATGNAGVSGAQTATENAIASGTTAESTEQDPLLKRFQADYDKLPANLKAKCPWEQAQARFSANGGEKLRLAQAMEEGGILFGVDKNGKLLFADKGDEPIMKGMNYPDTRARVLFKHDRLNKSGKMELGEDKKPISTGYEMFPFVAPYDKSDEILQYESSTGKPFVKSPNGAEWRSSWLESGEDASSPRGFYFDPNVGYTYVNAGGQQRGFRFRGVRRLLRV